MPSRLARSLLILTALVSLATFALPVTSAGATVWRAPRTSHCNAQGRCIHYDLQVEKNSFNGNGYVRADASIRCENSAHEPYDCWGVGDPAYVTIYRDNVPFTAWNKCGTFDGTTCGIPAENMYSPYVLQTGSNIWQARLQTTAGVVTFYGQDVTVDKLSQQVSLFG